MSQPLGSKIRVLIVDNSAFMRRALNSMLAAEADVEVLGTVGNWEMALKKVRELSPDVITLDLAMPVMDGGASLKRILGNYITSVLMVVAEPESAQAASVRETALDGLDERTGDVFDILTKPQAMDAVYDMSEELVRRVKQMSRRVFRHSGRRAPASFPSQGTPQAQPPAQGSAVAPAPAASPASSATPTLRPRLEPAAIEPAHEPAAIRRGPVRRFQSLTVDLICIGSSTGGPSVLEQIIRGLPSSLGAAVVIAQHMPNMFTRSMAERLNNAAQVPVVHAEDGMVIERGSVYIAPGGMHLQLARRGGVLMAQVSDQPPGYIYKPSVDVLFASAARLSGVRTLGVVLTGMGSDGANGGRQLVEAGHTIITQSKESCVVYGMPRAVFESGLAAASLSPAEIIAAIVQAGTVASKVG
jgi:two-component system chemotaxis response regulator CheB